MKENLLIVGGDSWSDPNEEYYADIDKIWPDYVAEFIDADVINISQGGAGNSFIYGQVIDAIMANPDRKIIVMVNWSNAVRLTPFEIRKAQLMFNDKKPAKDLSTRKFAWYRHKAQDYLRLIFNRAVERSFITEKEFWLNVANISLREIYLLNDYCRLRNIPIIHHRAMPILVGIDRILKQEKNEKLNQYVQELCKNNVYYQKILKFAIVFIDKSMCYFFMGFLIRMSIARYFRIIISMNKITH
jgi:hypothetical protein